MDKVANKANQGKPDPITNRVMSDACWNGDHFDSPAINRCNGWRQNGVPCSCACHDPREHKPKFSKKQQAGASMNILDTGCGTIEVGVSEKLKRQRETLREGQK